MHNANTMKGKIAFPMLTGNPRCAVLRVIGYMMYDQRVDTARVQRQRGRRREQHTVCVTSAEVLDASSVCSLVTVVLEPTRCFSGPRADVLLTALARLSLNSSHSSECGDELLASLYYQPHLTHQRLMSIPAEWLGQHVRHHELCTDEVGADGLGCELLAYEVIA